VVTSPPQKTNGGMDMKKWIALRQNPETELVVNRIILSYPKWKNLFLEVYMKPKIKELCQNLIGYFLIESAIMYFFLLILQNPEKYITILR